MTIVAISSTVFGAAVVLVLFGRRRFQERITAEVNTLLADASTAVGPEQLRARWDVLPDPARRYLRYAISEGAPATRTARLKHDGFLRPAPNSKWSRVDGEEYFTVARPGFVWNGRMWPSPLVWIEARDCLLAACGEMLIKLYSLFTIARGRNSEIDQAARLRWLAECVWFPYGFLGDDVHWEAIDDRSARVTLRQAGLPVVAVVEIDDEGKLTSIRADRYRDVGGGKAALTPWVGRCSEYRSFSGFRVPSSVEINWLLEDGEFNCIRFRVTALEYNVAADARGRVPATRGSLANVKPHFPGGTGK